MKEQIRLSERIIRTAFPQFTKPQQKVTGELINAINKTGSFTLRDIASNFQGETDVKHKLKKLHYFLDGLECNYRFWQSYVSLILSLPNLRLSKRGKVSITVSSKNLGASFRLLTANISYKNRPLPLFVKLWDSFNYPPSFASDVEEIVKMITGLLPDKHNYIFITDIESAMDRTVLNPNIAIACCKSLTSVGREK
jgi:hypothetical protein